MAKSRLDLVPRLIGHVGDVSFFQTIEECSLSILSPSLTYSRPDGVVSFLGNVLTN